LAKHGKRVLVLDLDLESPGIGQTLLPESKMPDFGIIDWLIEEAVDQADDSLLSEMVGTSPLMSSGIGEIRIVPAFGAQEKDYIAKLSRAYMALSNADFAQRLSRMLQVLEKQEKPDIVLLDSRAGMHDIAAITITRLNAYALLFAINTPQTWRAYRLLFQHWQKWHSNLEPFRDNLKIVAGMVPETHRADYLASCRQSAFDLFAYTLY
jgi:cellulose biosynthesis protein BcsQ